MELLPPPSTERPAAPAPPGGLRWWPGLVVAAVVLVVVALATRYVDHQLEERAHDEPAEWAAYFDLNTEGNLPTFFATALLLLIVTGLVVRAALAGSEERRAWTVLAVVAAALALDEATSVHERFLDPIGDLLGGGSGLLTFAWVVPGAVIAAGTGVLVVRSSRHLPASTRRSLAVATGVFLLGALGIEAVSGAVLDRYGHGSAYIAVTTVEEGLELAGSLLAVRAVLGGIRVRRRPDGLVLTAVG